MIFTRRIRWRFGDIDDAGIAYYPAFFHCFHCHFEDWWEDALGVRYARVLHDEHFGLPAVHVACDFYRPIRYGDEPDLHLGILELGETSVVFGYWMTAEGDGALVCRARVVTAAADLRTKKKREIPAHWRRVFGEWVIGEEAFPDAGEGRR